MTFTPAGYVEVMSKAGWRRSLSAIAPGEHVCWGYEDRDRLQMDMARLAQEGAERGEKVYVEQGHAGLGEVLAQEAAVARKEGFTGLRVICDATPLVRGTQLNQVLRSELALGREVADHSATVICTVHTTEIDVVSMANLVGCHSAFGGSAPSPLLSVHLASRVLTVKGEIDLGGRDLFRVALSQLEGNEVIDLSGVDFMDVTSMCLLRSVIDEAGHEAHLLGIPPVVERCWEAARRMKANS